jgi:hypothetical protein
LLALLCAAPPVARAQICSTTIQYGASLGDTTRPVSNVDLPIFVGTFSILSQDPRVGWRLGCVQSLPPSLAPSAIG